MDIQASSDCKLNLREAPRHLQDTHSTNAACANRFGVGRVNRIDAQHCKLRGDSVDDKQRRIALYVARAGLRHLGIVTCRVLRGISRGC